MQNFPILVSDIPSAYAERATRRVAQKTPFAHSRRELAAAICGIGAVGALPAAIIGLSSLIPSHIPSIPDIDIYHTLRGAHDIPATCLSAITEGATFTIEKPKDKFTVKVTSTVPHAGEKPFVEVRVSVSYSYTDAKTGLLQSTAVPKRTDVWVNKRQESCNPMLDGLTVTAPR